MELFYLPVSPYSHKAKLALLEKGADFTGRIVRPTVPEEHAAYKDLYPLGKLPLLKDGDTLLPESSIIVEYIDAKIPSGPRFIPESPEAAREVGLMDRWADSYLCDPAIRFLFQVIRPKESQDPIAITKYQQTIASAYNVIETALKKQGERPDFACGDTLTLADISLAPALRVCSKVVSFESYPTISHYFTVQSQREAFIAVSGEADQMLQKFMQELQASI